MNRAVWLLIAALACVPGRARAQAAETPIHWIAEEAAGILPLEDESSLVLRGVTGMLEVRTGKANELRWACSVQKGGTKLPLRVGAVGEQRLLVEAPTGDSAARTVLLVVPSRVNVEVEVEGSSLAATNLESMLTVRGKDLDVQLSNTANTVELELEGGRVAADRPRGRTVLRGRPQSATFTNVLGPLSLLTQGGILTVQDLQVRLDVDVQDSTLSASGILAPVSVRARGGEITMKNLSAGGDFDLSGALLHLSAVAGELNVNADAPVEIRESTAALHVHGIAAPVTVADHHGLVEVETDSAVVVLSKIDGPLRVRGNSLELRLDQTSDTGLITSGSSVEAGNVAGALAIENDLGDVTVRGVTGKVEVKNRSGNVTLLGLAATAVVETSSDVLTVGWASLPMDAEKESVLVNRDGEVRVELPPGGQLLLEAESRYGRVESALDWIRVGDDGKSAKGMRGRGNVPRLRVVGEGGVQLGGPGSGAALGERSREPEDDSGGGEP
ncbi:MAG TPA: hypothetical protein VFV75_21200 [Candidatus Polarisedimenticolaceae bacterium]|nr:hypothetical protein [Candidatus Polarisedimenticolaceae bacterium]